MSEMWINMGPQHPMTHGLWNLRVKVDGEIVTDGVAEIGYLHRGVEKIAEIKTYTEFIPLSDRFLCYAAAMSWEMTYVSAVEKLMGIEISKRASYIRTIVLELQRIASHLMWLASWTADLGFLTLFLYAMRDREEILDLMQMITGGRLHYVYMRFGGVIKDLSEKFADAALPVMDMLEKKIASYDRMLTESEAIMFRTKDLGIWDKEQAMAYGVTGPNLRASGVRKDLRKDMPYLSYPDFEFEIPAGKHGDTYDRYTVRMQEIIESTKIIRQALKKLPDGEYRIAALPKAPSKGTALSLTEDPRGMAAAYLVSDGTLHPYRLKFRSPTFFNIQAAVPHLIKNYRIADVPSIIGSIDVCLGEVDR